MFLYVISFTALFVAAAFGPTYLLLRKTVYAPYSILLSAVTCQPLLIVCVSLFGYRLPIPLKPGFVFAAILAGVGLTAVVVFGLRREIAATLGKSLTCSLLIFGLAMASMVLATPLLRHLAYIDWWNGEMVTYAYFAHGFLGLFQDPNYAPTFEQSATGRYGAELFLACLSILAGKAPLMLVNVLSALHKSSAIIAFAVACDVMRKERGLSPWATIAASVGFAFAAILALNHQLAFLASQAVTGSFILISLGLLGDGIKARGVQVLLAIHLLFVVISYSEAMPLLVATAAVVFLEAVVARRSGTPIAILAIFGWPFLTNPMLAVHRFGFLYHLRSALAGFNVLGSPKDNLGDYLAAALGFRYPFLNAPPLPREWLWSGISLALLAIAGAFLITARRLRTFVFLGVPLLLLLMHLNLGLSIQPPGSEFYKSYKLIAELNFYIFFSMAFLLDALLRPRSWRGMGAVPAILALGGCCLFLCANIFNSVRAAAAIRELPSIYREADVRRALSPRANEDRPLLFLISDTSASFWDLMANYLGVPRRLLDRNQARTIYHNASPELFEPTVIPHRAALLQTAKPETVFAGRIIISRIAGYSPDPVAVDVRATLAAAAPGLSLREDDIVFHTPAFAVVDGSLVNDAIAGEATGRTPNQPPSVIGVTPSIGQGPDAILSFVYSDPNGESDVDHLLITINTGLSTNDGCYLSYNRTTNQLGLLLDGNQAWDSAILGVDKKLENRNCAIDCAKCTTSGLGDEFTLRLVLKFKPPFAGRKMIHTAVADAENRTTGWEPIGRWDVP